jgi:hypothetical protein
LKIREYRDFGGFIQSPEKRGKFNNNRQVSIFGFEVYIAQNIERMIIKDLYCISGF